jgi:hypothetical protein
MSMRDLPGNPLAGYRPEQIDFSFDAGAESSVTGH